MFENLKPQVFVRSHRLVRSAGLFYRKAIELKDVETISAIMRDNYTHEELVLALHLGNEKRFLISEFDRGFKDVVNKLAEEFNGIKDIFSLEWSGRKLDEQVLWPGKESC